MWHDGEKQINEQPFNGGKMHSTMQEAQTYWLGVRRSEFVLHFCLGCCVSCWMNLLYILQLCSPSVMGREFPFHSLAH